MTDPAPSEPTPPEATPDEGRWSHRSVPDASAVPPAAGPDVAPGQNARAPQLRRGGPGAVVDVLTTPLITAGVAAVLLVLTVVAFAVKWLTADFSLSLAGQTLSLSSSTNGFGMQKVTGDLGSDSATAGEYLAFAIVTLVLIVVGAVLVLLAPRLRKIGAVVIALGGAVELVYGVLIAAGVIGMDKEDVLGDDLDTLRTLSPELAQQFEDAFSFGTGAGPWIAVVVGALAILLGVLFVVKAPGPLVPAKQTGAGQAAQPFAPGQPGQQNRSGQPGAAPQFPAPEPGAGRWSGDRQQ